MFDNILSLPLQPVTTFGKSSISDVWQGFELSFVWNIFWKTVAYLFTKFDEHIPSYIKQILYCVRSNPRDFIFNIFA